jgi:hypothetical protein
VTVAERTDQEEGEQMSSEPFTGGSNPDTGGRAIPPYEGRRESADVGDQSESEKEGAKVAGATGPVRDDERKAPDPADTARGPQASPADEQPAQDMEENEASDEGVGPDHVSGVQRGEDLSAPG